MGKIKAFESNLVAGIGNVRIIEILPSIYLSTKPKLHLSPLHEYGGVLNQ
jgi:hypothetical protein